MLNQTWPSMPMETRIGHRHLDHCDEDDHDDHHDIRDEKRGARSHCSYLDTERTIPYQ